MKTKPGEICSAAYLPAAGAVFQQAPPPGGDTRWWHACRARLAFTLIELLAVIAIIGVLAALAVPVLNNFKPNYSANFARTLMDQLARARQLAISEHTTVYMVFVPTNFWTGPNNGAIYGALPPVERAKADRLLDKQLIGYTFVSLHSLGDQPGRNTPHYLSGWRTLPEGAFISYAKFALVEKPAGTWLPIYTNVPGTSSSNLAFQVFGFDWTGGIPFPSEFTPRYNPKNPYIPVPYIAFDYLGRLTSGKDLVIPISKGAVSFARNSDTKVPSANSPTLTEQPPGNATNSVTYNLIYVNWLTGRARQIQQEVR